MKTFRVCASGFVTDCELTLLWELLEMSANDVMAQIRMLPEKERVELARMLTEETDWLDDVLDPAFAETRMDEPERPVELLLRERGLLQLSLSRCSPNTSLLLRQKLEPAKSRGCMETSAEGWIHSQERTFSTVNAIDVEMPLRSGIHGRAT
jgi:hypothetical protein